MYILIALRKTKLIELTIYKNSTLMATTGAENKFMPHLSDSDLQHKACCECSGKTWKSSRSVKRFVRKQTARFSEVKSWELNG